MVFVLFAQKKGNFVEYRAHPAFDSIFEVKQCRLFKLHSLIKVSRIQVTTQMCCNSLSSMYMSKSDFPHLNFLSFPYRGNKIQLCNDNFLSAWGWFYFFFFFFVCVCVHALLCYSSCSPFLSLRKLNIYLILEKNPVSNLSCFKHSKMSTLFLWISY